MKSNMYRVLPVLTYAALLMQAPVHGAAYPAGTFSFKPLNVNVAPLTIGFKNQDSKFVATGVNATSGSVFPLFDETRTVKTDAYKNSVPLGFSEADRNGFAAGFEVAYVVWDDWELFGRAGYCRENPQGRFEIADRSYDFSARHNYALGLGLRKYFDTGTGWKPYLAAAAGYVYQGQTTANVYWHFLLSNGPSQDELIGKYKLLSGKPLLSFEVDFGTDYVFHPNWALSAFVGIRYTQRGGSTIINTPGTSSGFGPLPPLAPRSDYYGDNKMRWYMPVTLSIKCIL